MNVSKVSTVVSDILSTTSKAVQKAPCFMEGEANPEKLTSALECLATNAIPSVKKLPKKVDLPEFIYHITSKENYEKILKDGQMKVSDWELNSDNGCKGIYFVDKNNFFNMAITR